MMATAAQTTTMDSHPFFDFNDTADLIPPRHDKDEIRSRLLDQLESVLLYLFPRGKRRGSQFYIGNLQGEPGDSLVVELEGPKRGVWIDFATGESGDLLALWASTRGYCLPNDFSELLEDAGDWLMMPRIATAPVLHTSRAYDDLGPHTGKWDYLAADGSLLACVYRHDTPSGKQYRPWDVRARAMRMPEPRPLYNLPAIAAAEAVVLVEGEKCADALMQLGIAATTAMGGAATAIDKTDWMPLAGKTVAVWPDHDEAGARYAAAAIQKLASIGATVRRVHVPQDKPAKWDAADAVAEGFDVEALLRTSQPAGGPLCCQTVSARAFSVAMASARRRSCGRYKSSSNCSALRPARSASATAAIASPVAASIHGSRRRRV